MDQTATRQATAAEWKGFTLAELEQFGVQRTLEGIEVPYFTRDGQRYRHKLFLPDGRTTWVGESKPQIPYGLDTLRHGGRTIILTEGESDALALRLAYPTLPVLGIPGASSWRSGWRIYVADFPVVYLSFDGDTAGDGLTDAVWSDLPAARRVQLPRGCDTRDVLQRLDKKAYRVLLEDAAHRSAMATAIEVSAATGKRRAEIEKAMAR